MTVRLIPLLLCAGLIGGFAQAGSDSSTAPRQEQRTSTDERENPGPPKTEEERRQDIQEGWREDAEKRKESDVRKPEE
jgi:hypothetical protein